MVLRDRAEFCRLVDGRFQTAVEFARVSGVNRQTIGWLRNGDRTSASRLAADALARALGVPTERLFLPWQSDDASPSIEDDAMLLTIPQTMKALGDVSESYVYSLISDGELPTTDIARRGSRKPKTRIPRTAVEKWIAARTTTAGSPAQ